MSDCTSLTSNCSKESKMQITFTAKAKIKTISRYFSSFIERIIALLKHYVHTHTHHLLETILQADNTLPILFVK